jgi:hypothetical protein
MVILSIPSITAKAKKVPINVSDLTGKGVSSVEIIVETDPTEVSIEGIETKGTQTEGRMNVFNNYVLPYTKSKAIFVMASVDVLSGNKPLIYLKVKNLKGKSAGAMITYYLLNEDTQFGKKP